MQQLGETLVVSPSDLVGYLECGHLTALDHAAAAGGRGAPVRVTSAGRAGDGGTIDTDIAVLQRRGLEHERAYLQALRDRGLTVVEIAGPERGDPLTALRRRADETVAAMQQGVDVIFQATFLDESAEPTWRGHADFVVRNDDLRSELGPFAYEPEDTKLARSVKASAVLQLCEYARQITRIQGSSPHDVRVVLGDGRSESVRLVEVAAYHEVARRRFEAALTVDPAAVYPLPVGFCVLCDWEERCAQQRVDDDHLSRVARLTKVQTRKLERTGITTMAELAASADGLSVRGVGDRTLRRLQRQARLQVAADRAEGIPYEALTPEPGQGLASLPEPDPGDLFYDIEGDPHVGDAGIEYLHGFGWEDDAGEFSFRPYWGHDRAGEKRAFEELVDFISERRRAHPGMHVYHYAPYETTALGKLMGRYGTREDELDDLLRGEVFVDLYRVVRQGVAIGTESYSIKKLEPLYMEARDAAITDAGSSIVEYERWLDETDPVARAQILADIERYNRDDVLSTLLLRGWLEDRRADLVVRGVEVPRPTVGQSVEEQLAREPTEADLAIDALIDRLLDGLSETGESDDPDQAARRLMSNLLRWHQREAKPEWWAYFDRVLHMDVDDLRDDTECIAGLRLVGEPVADKRSYIWTYEFDAGQEYKLAEGAKVVDPAVERDRLADGSGPKSFKIHDLDPSTGRLQLRRGTTSNAPHPEALVPYPGIGHQAQEGSLQRTAEALLDLGIDGSGSAEAARRLLGRLAPRLDGAAPGAPIRRPGEETVATAERAALTSRRSVLPIQGPPGAGKTYTAAHMITALIAAGHRVGITANSHAVISTVLRAVLGRAEAQGRAVRVVQKVSEPGQGVDHPSVVRTEENGDVVAMLDGGEVDIVAGTSWLFAREEMADRLHTLVVDEAGQLSLANVVAVAPAADDLVLVGDPQQLPQPSKGTHPDGAGASALEHLLDGEVTIPDDRGLFLDTTWRMHPAITGFISQQVYDDRLTAHPQCAGQSVADGPIMAGAGLRWLPVEHTGNRTSSPEEAEALDVVFRALLGRSWTNEHGTEAPIGVEDILVVAPYNAQVRELTRRLPEGAAVGTVDKFQGKEGAVVLVSLASSGAEEAPRGMEFLYSRNRLNVAVSRARALSVIVASPTLLSVKCRSLHQMVLANVLCDFTERADQITLPA